MVPVNNPHETQGRSPGRSDHFVCGLVGLGVVFGFFLVWYSAIVAFASGTLGVLSSTAIVWLFITGWLVLWVGIDVALTHWGTRRAPGDATSD